MVRNELKKKTRRIQGKIEKKGLIVSLLSS
jgi:hypothetical protein